MMFFSYDRWNIYSFGSNEFTYEFGSNSCENFKYSRYENLHKFFIAMANLLKIFGINETLVITNDVGWWCFDVFAKCSKPTEDELSTSAQVRPQFIIMLVKNMFIHENFAAFQRYFFTTNLTITLMWKDFFAECFFSQQLFWCPALFCTGPEWMEASANALLQKIK